MANLELRRWDLALRPAKTRHAVVGLLCWLAIGCDEEKPYTPFEVASTLPPLPSAAPPAPSPSAAPPAAKPTRRSVQAPRNASTWTMDGEKLTAPEGRVFERALRFDPDGDETLETVAWTLRQGKGDAPLGELYFFDGSAPPKKLASLPGFVPTGPGCAVKAELVQAGLTTVALDVRGDCRSRLVARAPVRALLVIAPTAAEPLVAGFRAAEAAPGEHLDWSVSSADHDSDGKDDLELRVSVRSEGTKDAASAIMRWFERPAGRSRDASEPLQSFRNAAERELTRSKKKSMAAGVNSSLDNYRRLYSSLCGDSGTPRVWHLDGSPLHCGNIDSAFQIALEAEFHAHISLGDELAAIGTLLRDGWFGAPLEDKRRNALEQAIRRAIADGEIESSHSLPAALPPRGLQPRFSPLRFGEHEGREVLMLRNSRNQVEIAEPPFIRFESRSLGAGGAPPDDTGPAIWPLLVTGPAGQVWTAVVPSCNRSEIQLSFLGRDGRPRPDLPTSLLAPRPGACRGLHSKPLPAPVPVGFQQGKLVAWVGGAWVGHTAPFELSDPPAGSPLNRDGGKVVLPTPVGLVIASEPSIELWRPKNPFRTLPRECVLSADADVVACVLDDRASVYRRPAALTNK